MNKETIIIDGLTKQFKNTLAVKNINFKINKGKIDFKNVKNVLFKLIF